MDEKTVREILDTAIEATAADEVEVHLWFGDSALTRFANNEIHQNVTERSVGLSITAIHDQRLGTASTNQMDPDSIRRCARQAAEIARFAARDPDLPPRIGPQTYQKVNAHFPATAPTQFGPEKRAEAVREAVELAKREGLTLAGTFRNGEGGQAIANSNGLFAYYRSTSSAFTVTATGPDSTGWAEASDRDVERLPTTETARKAIEKALASANPRSLEPGAYAAILEPAAVAGLLGFMMSGFNALAVDEGRVFTSGKVGQQIVGENITIRSDKYHPLFQGCPFDGEGYPTKTLTLIDKGIVRDLAYDRVTAKRHGVEPTGHAGGGRSAHGAFAGLVAGGEDTVADIVAKTDRAVLVTRTWYENFVDPMEVIVTGMTRDGLFLVEDGKICHAVRNFRFNQNVLEMLKDVRILGRPELAGGMIVPPVLVGSFDFSSPTSF